MSGQYRTNPPVLCVRGHSRSWRADRKYQFGARWSPRSLHHCLGLDKSANGSICCHVRYQSIHRSLDQPKCTLKEKKISTVVLVDIVQRKVTHCWKNSKIWRLQISNDWNTENFTGQSTDFKKLKIISKQFVKLAFLINLHKKFKDRRKVLDFSISLFFEARFSCPIQSKFFKS